jgi:hypothetical protein
LSRAASAARTSTTSPSALGPSAVEPGAPAVGTAAAVAARGFEDGADFAASAGAGATPGEAPAAPRTGEAAGASSVVRTGAEAEALGPAMALAAAGGVAARTLAVAETVKEDRCSTSARMPSFPIRRCNDAAVDTTGSLRGVGDALRAVGTPEANWRSDRMAQAEGGRNPFICRRPHPCPVFRRRRSREQRPRSAISGTEP